MTRNMRRSAEPAAVKVKEIEGDSRKSVTHHSSHKIALLHSEGLYEKMVGRRYVSTPWLGAWSVLWPGSRRGVTMWVSMSLLSILSAGMPSCDVIQQSSTGSMALSCTDCYSGRIAVAPCRISRWLGAGWPASPTTNTCPWTPSVYLWCNEIEARLGLRFGHNTQSYCWVLLCTLGVCRSTRCAQLCSCPWVQLNLR